MSNITENSSTINYNIILNQSIAEKNNLTIHQITNSVGYKDFLKDLPENLRKILSNNSIDPNQLKTITKIQNVMVFNLFGEQFYFEFEENEFTISHKVWSLLGHGKTFFEAIISLLNQAKEIKSEYVDCSISELSTDALELKEFLLKVV